MAARMPMMAITTSSSINVKPVFLLTMRITPWVGPVRRFAYYRYFIWRDMALRD
jgi:hypothetical protein